jgi:hypothetical protein
MIADLTDSNRILTAPIIGGRPVRTRQKFPNRLDDVANGIKRFEKGMRDDESHGKRPSESESAQIGGDHQLSAPVARLAHQLDNATVKTSPHWRYGFRRGTVVFPTPETWR